MSKSLDVDPFDLKLVAFWGSPLVALMAEAEPGTIFFEALKTSLKDTYNLDHAHRGTDFHALRLHLELTHEEAAQRLGVSLNYLFGLEMGWVHLDLPTAIKYADRLNVPYARLYTDPNANPWPLTLRYVMFSTAAQAMGNDEVPF